MAGEPIQSLADFLLEYTMKNQLQNVDNDEKGRSGLYLKFLDKLCVIVFKTRLYIP